MHHFPFAHPSDLSPECREFRSLVLMKKVRTRLVWQWQLMVDGHIYSPALLGRLWWYCEVISLTVAVRVEAVNVATLAGVHIVTPCSWNCDGDYSVDVERSAQEICKYTSCESVVVVSTVGMGCLIHWGGVETALKGAGWKLMMSIRGKIRRAKQGYFYFWVGDKKWH